MLDGFRGVKPLDEMTEDERAAFEAERAATRARILARWAEEDAACPEYGERMGEEAERQIARRGKR